MADSFDQPASGFEDTTLPTDAPQEIREDRINKKLFEDLSLSGQVLEIIIKVVKDADVAFHLKAEELCFVPIEVAKICSKKVYKIYSESQKSKAKAKDARKNKDDFYNPDGKSIGGNVLTLNKYDSSIPLWAYKWVLDWMAECGRQLTVVQVDYMNPDGAPRTFSHDPSDIEEQKNGTAQREVEASNRPKKSQKEKMISKPLEEHVNVGDNYEDIKAITNVVDIMKAAKALDIPYASFNKFIVKKLERWSRDFLVDFELIEPVYKGDKSIDDLGLKDVVAKSIFENWYNWVLEWPQHEDYMCGLHDLRQQYEELDQDLHNKLKDKDEWLKGRRAKRAAQREEEEAQANGGGFDDDNGGDQGFGDAGQADAETEPRERQGWEDADATATEDQGDWGDEANDAAAAQPKPLAAQPSNM